MKQTLIIRDHRFKARAIELIEQVPTDVPHAVSIAPYKSKRSLAQNRLYWMWMQEIADHVFESTGQQYSSEDVHEWLKAQLLGKRAIEIRGEPVIVSRSTTKLGVAEFTEYLERIDHYAVEHLGLTLTHPEDLVYEAMRRAA